MTQDEEYSLEVLKSLEVLRTHHWTQIDERLGVTMLRMAGATNARVELTDAGRFSPDGRSAEELEAAGILGVGVGGGWADEHRLKREVQETGVSSALIVGTKTGFNKDKAMMPIIEYVTENDAWGGSTPWDLATLNKNLNDHMANLGCIAAKSGRRFTPEEQFERVQLVVDGFFRAKYAKNFGWLEEAYDPTSIWSKPDEYIALWLVRRLSKTTAEGEILEHEYWQHRGTTVVPRERDKGSLAFRVAKRLGIMKDAKQIEYVSLLLAFASRQVSDPAAMTWDFEELVRDREAFVRFNAGQDVFRNMLETVFTVLDAKYYNQVQFMDAADEVRDPKITQLRWMKRPGMKKDRLAIITTDNLQTCKAVRTIEPPPRVVVNKRGNDQVSIFTDADTPLENIAERIILEEMRIGNLSREEAQRRWFHFRRNNANWLLNGGLSAPGVHPTCVPLWLIEKIITEELETVPVVPRSKRLTPRGEHVVLKVKFDEDSGSD